MEIASNPERKGPVLVAVGLGSPGELLVSRGKAVAEDLWHTLTCLTVDEGGMPSEEAQSRLVAMHEFARSKGAEVARVPGVDVARTIADYADAQGSPTVIVGSGSRGRSADGIAQRLRAMRRGFDLVVVCPPERGSRRRARERSFPMSGPLSHYALAVLTVACVTLAGLGLASYAGYWSAAILYLAAISLGALWLEPGPILLAAVASAFAWDFLFIPPRFTLTIDNPADDLMLALYAIVSVASGLMTSRLRASEGLLRRQGRELTRINALAASIAEAGSKGKLIERCMASIRGAIDCEPIAILEGDGGRLKPEPESGWTALDAAARSAAKRCFEEGESTGRFTHAFPSSEWHFVPVDSGGGRLGVIGIRRPRGSDWDDAYESCVRSTASAMAASLSRIG